MYNSKPAAMDAYFETFETWNKIAVLYEENFMDLTIYNESYDTVCRLLSQENASILEIGCGPGNISKYLLSQRPDFQIHGIDVSPNMISLASKNNPTASFSVFDVRNLHEINENYDAIIAGFCLPYLATSDVQKLVKDSHILLHDNGILYLSFVEGNPENSGFQTGSSGYRCYFYYHQLSNLKSILLHNGFEDFQEFQVEYLRPKNSEVHTIVIARKK